MDEVLAEPAFALFRRFRVDFDAQTDVLRQLKVEHRATILAYICNEEIGRIVGDTDAGTVRKLLAKTQIA